MPTVDIYDLQKVYSNIITVYVDVINATMLMLNVMETQRPGAPKPIPNMTNHATIKIFDRVSR